MKNSLIARIEALENKLSHSIPDFETFKAEWAIMDELSRALFIFYAEQPQTWENSERRYMEIIRGYLDAMGLVDRDAKSITELVSNQTKDRYGEL